MSKPRLIAYYLPQYYPIPENDAWWGNGFTEWTNVASAKPLFKGHYQPHIPADLGFYDLRVPEVRQAQADLARAHGIEGFCYWHYWFGGKRLLDRPFNEVLASGEPDFPFCLAWANTSWTGTWYGAPDQVLIEQTYPGDQDHIDHFNHLLPAFQDQRYIQVDGSPLFLVYQPSDFSKTVVELWQAQALAAGLPRLYLLGIVKNAQEAKRIQSAGFDGCTISRTNGRGTRLPWLQHTLTTLMGRLRAESYYQQLFKKPFHVYQAEELLPYIDLESDVGIDFFPCVMPNWDNTPRAGIYGHVFQNPSPKTYERHLEQAIHRVSNNPPEQQIIIIKSWNEWAEGNYLEPDQRYGHGFLKVVQQVVESHGE